MRLFFLSLLLLVIVPNPLQAQIALSFEPSKPNIDAMVEELALMIEMSKKEGSALTSDKKSF